MNNRRILIVLLALCAVLMAPLCVFAGEAQFHICRTSGFWGTHAGTEKKGSINITQDVINATPNECLAVCGQEINNTSIDNANSAVEALCVSTQGVAKVQLADQLTAATLNCVMSNATTLVSCSTGNCATCSVLFVPGFVNGAIDIGSLVHACNDACINGDATATITPLGGNPVTVNCIAALNCFNNGGVFDPGTGPSTARCQTGTCSISHLPCGIEGLQSCPKVSGRTQTCVPFANNCESSPLCQVTSPGNFFELCFDATKAGVKCPTGLQPARICTNTPGTAGSSNECNAAIGNQCTIVEGGCSAGTSGECTCPAGQTLCSGTCVDTSTDKNNCGSCGNQCPGNIHFDCCSGSCTDTSTDTNNCGGCDTACSGGQSCVSGSCTCPAGETLCGSTCVNTQTDNNNCGGCGTTCSGATGTCCDSTCVDLQTDKTHCGSCGTSCPGNIHFDCCSGSCADLRSNATCGSCNNACSGLDTCCTDGNSMCVDTSSDKNNCGSCGNVCPSVPNATATCTGGHCGFTCNSNFFDCNGNASDGCECPVGCSGTSCT